MYSYKSPSPLSTNANFPTAMANTAAVVVGYLCPTTNKAMTKSGIVGHKRPIYITVNQTKQTIGATMKIELKQISVRDRDLV